jgi:hypothetical protein
VSSQDAGESPQPERFQVTRDTAALVNAARARGGRVIAVGTTATRAIESATSPNGIVDAVSGWTDLVIGPDRPVRVVDGLLTGWHNPEASHLLLVEAVAGAELTQRAYDAAVAHGVCVARVRRLWPLAAGLSGVSLGDRYHQCDESLTTASRFGASRTAGRVNTEWEARHVLDC